MDKYKVNSDTKYNNQDLHCRLINTWDEFDQLKSQWDLLLQQSDADTIFLTWDWINCWYKTTPYPITPYILILETEHDLVAVAPFYLQTFQLFKVFSFKALRILADQGIGSEYSDFIVKSNDSYLYKQLLWSELQRDHQRKSWDFIWFTNIATWRTGGKNLIDSLFSQSELRYQERTVDFASTPLDNLQANTKIDQQTNILSQLSKSLRTNIKQTTKHLSKTAAPIFRVSQQETLNQDLENLFNLHNQRWNYAGTIGSFAKRPQLADFYRAFAPIALAKKQLCILTLEHAGKAKAMQYSYVYNLQYLAMQEGFDPTSEKGIGQVLRLHAFELCRSRDINEYDFLGGYTNHKRRWLAQKRSGKNIFIYSPKCKNIWFIFGLLWPSGRYLTPIK